MGEFASQLIKSIIWKEDGGWWLVVEATLVYRSKQTLINGCLGK